MSQRKCRWICQFFFAICVFAISSKMWTIYHDLTSTIWSLAWRHGTTKQSQRSKEGTPRSQDEQGLEKTKSRRVYLKHYPSLFCFSQFWLVTLFHFAKTTSEHLKIRTITDHMVWWLLRMDVFEQADIIYGYAQTSRSEFSSCPTCYIAICSI